MTKTPKKPGTAVVKWDEEFANLAKESTKGLSAPTAKFISIRSGKMSFAGADIPGNELRAVVVGWIYENQYYDEDFDPDVPQTPACYAFSTSLAEMMPHGEAPNHQHTQCNDCPMNEFGSADRGKGKACKNVIRLALIAESDLDNIEAAEVCYLKIPVMSVKNWTMYAKKTVADVFKRPYWAVVTTIGVEPDNKSQFKVVFNREKDDLINDPKLFGPLKALWEKTMENIDFPYPKREEIERPAPKRGGKDVRNAKFARRK